MTLRTRWNQATSLFHPPVQAPQHNSARHAGQIKIAAHASKDLISKPQIGGFGNLSKQAQSLASHLAPLQKAELQPTEAVVQDLRVIQRGIDTLKAAAGNERNAQAPTAVPSTQPLATASTDLDREIHHAQQALDKIIAGCAGKLSGNALKEFMKELYPEPDQLIAHAERILPPAQQRELVKHSKRIQRHTGIATSSDIGNRLELVRKELKGKPRQDIALSKKAKGLSWAATRADTESQQERGIRDMGKAYLHLRDSGMQADIVSALQSLVDGFDNLRSSTLKEQALEVFYQNYVAAASQPDRSMLLMSLLANRRDLPAAVHARLDDFIDQHFDEALDALPSANQQPELQQPMVDKACRLLLDSPEEGLAQTLAGLCGNLEQSSMRAQIALSLMAVSSDSQNPEPLRQAIDAAIPDMIGYLPRMQDKPETQAMVIDMARDKLAEPTLPPHEKRVLLASMASALSQLKQQEDVREQIIEIMRPHAAELVAALPAMKASEELQDAVLGLLHQLFVQHQQGKAPLPVDARLEIAEALASTYTAHIEKGPKFANMRSRFVDDEVRNVSSPKETIPFSVENHVLDLTHVPPDVADGPLAQEHTRKARILPIAGADNRAKEIAYGPRPAAAEAVSTDIMAGTGHAAPKTKFARYTDIPQVIASQLIPGFKDLGQLVLDEDSVRPMIEKEWGAGGLKKLDAALDRAWLATQELDKLNREQPVDVSNTDPITMKKQDAIRERFQARKAIYNLLPAEIHHKTGKAQFMAQLPHDVDFLNFEWFNFGFTRNGVAVVLDEGNCLDRGFKGKTNGPDNLEFANKPARFTDPYQRPNQVTEKDHAFGDDVGASIVNTSGIARSIPVAAVLSEATRAQARLAEFGGDHANMTSVPGHEMQALSGQMEGAFQLALYPDEAIRHLVTQGWPEPDNEMFQYEEGDKKWTAEGIANTLIARRKALVGKFTPKELELWEAKNPAKAKAAYDEAAAAIADMTGIYIPARTPGAQGVEGSLRAQLRRTGSAVW